MTRQRSGRAARGKSTSPLVNRRTRPPRPVRAKHALERPRTHAKRARAVGTHPALAQSALRTPRAARFIRARGGGHRCAPRLRGPASGPASPVAARQCKGRRLSPLSNAPRFRAPPRRPMLSRRRHAPSTPRARRRAGARMGELSAAADTRCRAEGAAPLLTRVARGEACYAPSPYRPCALPPPIAKARAHTP